MNEDQMRDAAEREMDLYRREITALREALAEARGETQQARDAIAALLAGLKASADATRPSKKTAIEDELAGKLQAILEGK